jgi:adenylate cyclase
MCNPLEVSGAEGRRKEPAPAENSTISRRGGRDGNVSLRSLHEPLHGSRDMILGTMPDVERKLAAILAADVVGYSRLTGTDEEGTLGRLRELRDHVIHPAVQAHRGRIVKEMGDGIIIEFLSAVDAARAALDIQRQLGRRNAGLVVDNPLELRIGIHIGDVVVHPDGDVLGETVNIAARLEGIAQPGGICLSEDAYRQIRDRLPARFQDLGEQQLKNIVHPLRVYAMQIGDHDDRIQAPAEASKPGISRQAERNVSDTQNTWSYLSAYA